MVSLNTVPKVVPTPPQEEEEVIQFSLSMRKELRKQLARLASDADMTMIPKITVAVTEPAMAERVLRLVNALDENDDVQNVYANFDIPDELLSTML